MLEPLKILQQYWGYTTFRGKQQQIIESVLQQKHVVALLPTGGGKSICYQVPTLCLQGVCVVVSPLIALMKDQVEQLQQKGINAVALHSGLAKEELINILQKAEQKHYSFIYISPERLQNAIIKEYLPHLPIVLLAIDEAHCISQWGYDFRPSYLLIKEARLLLPNIPCIAVTATATPLVQQDIIQQLNINHAQLIKQSFEKPNLSFSVFKVDSKINKLIHIIQKVNGSTIVYCKNRKQTQEVSKLLQLQGISADYYHAGLNSKERSNKQKLWMQNKLKTIVCTNAFGMGIDKADVRVVVHMDIPESIENYYQEAGRAGRDLQKSYAVLLYTNNDIETLKQLPNLRFPSVEIIKKIYQHLADYLQIPVGIGKDNIYSFDFAHFVTAFKLTHIQAIAVLKILEQDGHILLSDNVYKPSTVLFTTNKETLDSIEQVHPTYSSTVKALLRTYHGILDNEVHINETQISKALQQPESNTIEHLKALHQLQILQYNAANENPSIQFLLNRAPASFLYINEDALYKRKAAFNKRLEAIIQYTTGIQFCRSNYLASYFEEPLTSNCGICDNCLHQKQQPISANTFKMIEENIYAILQTQTINFNTLTQHLQYPKQQIQQVLQFLIEQEKLVYTNGKYALKKRK